MFRIGPTFNHYNFINVNINLVHCPSFHFSLNFKENDNKYFNALFEIAIGSIGKINFLFFSFD